MVGSRGRRDVDGAACNAGGNRCGHDRQGGRWELLDVKLPRDDAIALMKLNLEFYPRSVNSYMTLAFAQTRKLDDLGAIATLEKALEIDPDNSVAKGRLEQLKSYHRQR